MKHDAAVKERVVWRAFLLFTNKAVFKPQVIVRERGFVIQMTKLIVEIAVLIIANPDHEVLYNVRQSLWPSGQPFADFRS